MPQLKSFMLGLATGIASVCVLVFGSPWCINLVFDTRRIIAKSSAGQAVLDMFSKNAGRSASVSETINHVQRIPFVLHSDQAIIEADDFVVFLQSYLVHQNTRGRLFARTGSDLYVCVPHAIADYRFLYLFAIDGYEQGEKIGSAICVAWPLVPAQSLMSDLPSVRKYDWLHAAGLGNIDTARISVHRSKRLTEKWQGFLSENEAQSQLLVSQQIMTIVLPVIEVDK